MAKQESWHPGELGCFSFQASKNLNSGEGGAIVTNSDDLFEQCKSFQNNGRGAGERGLQLHAQWGESADHGVPGSPFISAAHTTRGTVALPRTRRGLSHAAIAGDSRNHAGENLRWLHCAMPIIFTCFGTMQTSSPVCRGARFLQALHAEGVPCSGGYQPLYKEPFLANTLRSRAFQAIYAPKRISEYLEHIQCPVNDRLCESAVWLTQTTLLGTRSDMDDIAVAVRKVQNYAAKLAKA